MSDEPEPLPLARPSIGEREEELVLEVLSSGVLSLGPMQDRFESAFATRLGVDDAVAVSSGTAALHLGVRALGWEAGDEVVTSPLSFVASANCLLFEDVKPVFCDVDAFSLNLDPLAAEAAIGRHTAGLLPVHIFGYPADMPAIDAIGSGHDLAVLEDGCEALGATDAEGEQVGSRGNPCAFAFYANKQMTTGEGGMLIPADAEMAARVRSERNQGRAPDMSWLGHERLGFNYRLGELAAALGVAQLERLEELLTLRAQVAAAYRHGLEGLGGCVQGEGDPAGLVIPAEGRGDERRSWFVYVIQLPEGADRDAIKAELGRAGVPAKDYLPCIHLYPHYRERFGHREGEFPVAEAFSRRSLALPFFPEMGEGEVTRVCTALGHALSHRG